MAEPKREWSSEDEEAAREGRSISLGNARRVRITNKKPKAKNVDTRALENAFDEHYGATGYTAKKGEEDEDKRNNQ